MRPLRETLTSLLKTRTLRVVAILLALLAAYAAAGFWLVPRLLRAQIVAQTHARLGLEASVGAVQFNPFSFRLRVANLALASSGRRLAGFVDLVVDFEPRALLRREYAFRAIDLRGLYLNAVVGADGRLNLARLAPQSAPPQPAATTPAPWPRIRIDRLRVDGANFRYEDRAHPGDFTLRFAPAEFELTGFTTGANGGAFAFSARTAAGERIDWQGRLAVAPLSSSGDLRIAGLRAATVEALLHDRFAGRVAAALTGGRFGVDVPYRLTLEPQLQLRIDGASASAADLGVAPAGSTADYLRVAKLAVAGASLDLAAHQVRIGRVALGGLDVDAALERDGKLNLASIVAGPPTASQAQASAGAAPAPAGAAPRWKVELAELSVSDGRLAVADRRTTPVANFVLAPLSARIDDASLDLSRPVRITLATGVDGGGRVAASGSVVPAPLAANLVLTARGLDLRALQPYVAEHAALTVESGRLDAKLALAMPKGLSSLRLAGDLSVDGVRTIDDGLHRDLVDWRRVDVQGMRLSLQPARLAIAAIVARRPYARVIIEPDRSLNVKRILSAPGAAAAAVKIHQPAAVIRTAQPAVPAASKPMRITVGRVDVEDGNADFSDLSITPHFSSGIGKLNGRILGLDSAPGARAKVDLKGEAGPYSPVSISGEVNLFGPELYTNLTMNFSNMDLTIFNPYSGKFAGYEIRKGKLTTAMHYQVRGRKLVASHHVIIDQLEFGARTNSKDATSLPLKLAVALLKDRHGVIDLNIPVTGSLDDPQFRLAPLIWKIVVNIIEKAVTAPFKLLGALFGAGPQIQYVDFRAGDATLDATDLDRLRTVARALQSRPLLKVDVPIAPLPSLDGPALAAARFWAQIAEQMLGRPGMAAAPARAAGAEPAAGAAQAATSSAFGALAPRAQLAVLTALYQGQLQSRPKFPTAAQSDAAKAAYLESLLRSRNQAGPGALKALAERRAIGIEKALLTGTGVDPARVFLVVNEKVAADNGAVRLQLTLR